MSSLLITRKDRTVNRSTENGDRHSQGRRRTLAGLPVVDVRVRTAGGLKYNIGQTGKAVTTFFQEMGRQPTFGSGSLTSICAVTDGYKSECRNNHALCESRQGALLQQVWLPEDEDGHGDHGRSGIPPQTRIDRIRRCLKSA